MSNQSPLPLIRAGVWPSLGRPWWVVWPEAVRVGRGSECEIRLEDPAVSWAHAEIRMAGGRLELCDLGSRNGTLVEGRPVERASLEAGREVEVGGYLLRFWPVEPWAAPPEELETLVDRLLETGRNQAAAAIARNWSQAAEREPGAQRCLARVLLARGRVEQAALAAERAAALAPDEAATLWVLGLAAERGGRLEQARELQARALALEPEHAGARRSLGRVELKLEVYGRVRALAGLRDGSPPPAPKEWAELRAGIFVFRFRPGDHGTLVLNAYAALARVAERLARRLGFRPTEPVEVYLEDKPGPGGASRPAALYDGAIRLYRAGLESDEPDFLYLALAHEYVHLAVDRITGGNRPAWLDEGLAQVLTQGATPRDRRILLQALQAGSLLPLALLENDFVRLEHPRLVDLACAQARGLVEFLRERGGMNLLRGLLRELGRGASAEEALRSVAGLDRQALEQAWLEWLG